MGTSNFDDRVSTSTLQNLILTSNDLSCMFGLRLGLLPRDVTKVDLVIGCG